MSTLTLVPPGPDATPEEVDEYREKMAETAMRADGVATESKVAVDYFGTDVTDRVTLPDGVSWVEHKVLNEGERRAYLNKTNREVTVKKASGDAVMKMAPGTERFELLKKAIVGWNLVSGGSPVAFSTAKLEEFLTKANPKVVDVIQKAVYLANPWLMGEISIEEIDQQIQELTELRAKKVEEEEGKGSS